MTALSPTAFALFRHPYSNRVCVTLQEGDSPQTLTQVREIDQINGFVMAPFRITEQTPITWVRGDKRAELENPTETDLQRLWEGKLSTFLSSLGAKPLRSETVETTPSSYRHRFDLFRDKLQEKKIEKLVLGSAHLEVLAADIDLLPLFLSACAAYPRMMVYLCYTPSTGLWLGASPEILLTASPPLYHTVALAGSMPVKKNQLPAQWSQKNRREQQMVSDYIEHCLLRHGVTPRIEGPYTARAGGLAHLKTDFYAEGEVSLGELVNALHPTPAVCGLPKQEAYDFINLHEGFDRRYYTGFMGVIEGPTRCSLYVNLRCMELNGVHKGDALTLYAGGGLLAASTAESEWEEIQYKLKTMKSLIIEDTAGTI